MYNDRLIIMQYLLHKGDHYRSCAKSSTEKMQRKKVLTSSELEQIYKDLLMNELFDSIQHDLCRLLDIIP